MEPPSLDCPYGLVMPKLSGLDVLERVMEIDPSTDVVLMTAHYSS